MSWVTKITTNNRHAAPPHPASLSFASRPTKLSRTHWVAMPKRTPTRIQRRNNMANDRFTLGFVAPHVKFRRPLARESNSDCERILSDLHPSCHRQPLGWAAESWRFGPGIGRGWFRGVCTVSQLFAPWRDPFPFATAVTDQPRCRRPPHAKIGSSTRPETSVSRKSRPP